MPIYKCVDKKFFRKWSSEMAYILGFFAADGYMGRNKRGAHFWSIQITDKLLLENIRKAIKSEHKISIKQKRQNENTQYRLQVGSIEMYQDLLKLGFTESKTKSLVIPKITKRYLPHFIRGYFDGDGNVWVGYINKKRKTPTLVLNVMFTSCSTIFLEQLKERLTLLGISGGSIYKAQGNYSRLQFSTLDAWKIYEIMYNKSALGNSDLFLERKRKVFQKYVRLKLLRS
ncbi:MAG TPA: LAGLIDADG family homing endonuclease [Candidatus Paceibacterota bacterium]